MLIDWFTVGAQALNFLVLVWLLKRFLYKPILNAIDAREKGIAGQLADADAKKTEAEKEQTEFQAKNKAFDEQRTALLQKAAADAGAERGHLLDDARAEADKLRSDQAIALRNDRTRLGNEITRTAKDEVFAIARKTLTDLAGASLEERVGAVFTRRLGQMDAQAKETMAGALRAASEPALVASAFDLPAAQRATIQNALNETFSADVRLRFETAGDAICGIEFSSNGQKIGWSIEGYLTELDRKVDELLDAQPAPASSPSMAASQQKTEPAKPDPKTAPSKRPPVEVAVGAGAR